MPPVTIVSVTIQLLSHAKAIIEGFSALDLEERLKDMIKTNFDETETFVFYPIIRRCLKHKPYKMTSDCRLTEIAYDELLFEEQSPYQLVQIAETKDFGRILIIDDIINLSEYDTAGYTHAVMNLPEENYDVRS